MVKAFLSGLTLICVGFGVTGVSQDEPSAFEKCRYVTGPDLADAKAPSFRDFSVNGERARPPFRLDLASNPIAKRYRTVLRLDVEKGPNFAGHYRVVFWGCGTSCVMFAAVNLESGRVITPPDFGDVSGVLFDAADFLSEQSDPSSSSLVRFNAASRLLVVIGDLDEDESREGAFYFVLEREKLRLVHTTKVKKDCEALRSSKKPR
jgi:hypothetical protein